MSSLSVYLHADCVGELERRDQGRLRFTYSREWLETGNLVLSHSLPLRLEPFDDDEARPFFAGLLPEGDFLRAVARSFHVSAGNPFSLLSAIGGECAGAVSLAESGGGPPRAGAPKWLNAQALADLIRELPRRPLLAGEDGEGLRLSLAGTQEKLPVIFQGGHVGITRGDPPSTHVIKLPSAHVPDMTANEAFCLSVARHAGLDAVEAQARSTSLGFVATPDDDEYLLVTRYDRADEGGPVKRLHQEDLCQGLGFVPELKYESDGGPGIAQCADHIRSHCAVPAVDVLAFADALIFNLLVGNHDAHSKNYSLLLEGPRTPRLAPLYDVLSTTAYPELHRKTAMKYGGENRPDYIRGRHLTRTANDLGMSGVAFRDRARRLADAMESAVAQAKEHLPAASAEQPIITKICERIRVGTRRVSEACDEIEAASR